MPPSILGFVIILVSFLIQTTLVPYLRIGNAQPDVILIVVVTYAFIEGPAVGSLVGFFGGLLEDLLLIRNMGLNMLCKAIVGYVAGLVERTIFAESILLPMMAIFIAGIFNQTLYAGFNFLLGYEVPIRSIFVHIIVLSAVYSSLLTPLIYPLLCKLIVRKKKVPLLK